MIRFARTSLYAALFLLLVVPCIAQSLAVSSGELRFVPVSGLPTDLSSQVTPTTPGYTEDSGVAFLDLAQYALAIGATMETNPEQHTVRMTIAERELVFFTVTPQQFLDAHQGLTLGKVEALPQPEDPARLLRTTCVRVIDGDTIEIENGERVRYIGIDTPEMNADDATRKHFAEVAKRINRGMVEGRQIVVELGVEERDHYGRLLGYVYSGNVFVNAALVAGGYAQAATYPPNVKHADLFAALAAKAREANRGLWAAEADVAKEEAAQETREAAEPAPEPEERGPQQPVAAPAQVTVYITETGGCYHRAGCSSLRRSKIAVSLAAAKQRGYTPCGRCNPPG